MGNVSRSAQDLLGTGHCGKFTREPGITPCHKLHSASSCHDLRSPMAGSSTFLNATGQDCHRHGGLELHQAVLQR
jgi:hypothetical protein